ncbi:MAG: hypothetical protein ACKO3T_18120 [Planctomycetaceae bacterium]
MNRKGVVDGEAHAKRVRFRQNACRRPSACAGVARASIFIGLLLLVMW